MGTLAESIGARQVRSRALRLPRAAALRWIALGAIVALAAGLRCANLAALGYANHYYAAAVKSMLQSWHNFFFVAAEPGAAVSVDKPPVGLWLQAASAYVFGVDSFGLLLPQILAGILSVVVVYHLVRRWFGTAAGLLAALVLAITPIAVATDRNNTIDSTLILTLLLAAWAFSRATESGKLRHLLLGAALVGVGFNIKMLEAFLPLPAFCALYFFGAAERFWAKIGRLALAAGLLAAVSLSWALAVDLTPPDQRPYVGSSSHNSVLDLAFGYNGAERLVGMRGSFASWWSSIAGRQGLRLPIFTAPGTSNPQPGFRARQGGQGAAQPGQRGTNPGSRAQPAMPPGGAAAAGGAPARGQQGGFGGFRGFGGFGGASGTGRSGPLRLFLPPLSKESGWLLPFALFSAVLLLCLARPAWPVARQHRAALLWGGWLLVGGAFFSVAGFFHEYYLSILAPPVAALTGIGVAEMWRLGQRYRWLAVALLLAAAGGTLWLQRQTVAAFVRTAWWLPLAAGLLAVGAVVLVLTAALRWRPGMLVGTACVVAALLLTPGIWAGLTTANSSANQSLPAAYSGRPSGPPNRGGLQVDQALLAYVESRTQGTEYLMAVPSSMQGADYVLATGRPVLYLGGFMGQDRVETSASLARLVADGRLRFVYWDARGFGQQADISSWVTSHCAAVQGYDTSTVNAGAPDGTAASSSRGWGGMRVSLYDCRG